MIRSRRKLHPAPWAAVLVSLIVASAATGPATAAPGPAAARLVVTAGAAGGYLPGQPIPVRVEVDSDVLVSGQIVVTSGSFQLSRPVEVAGGSSQRLELIVPTPRFPGSQQPLGVHVSLEGRGARLAQADTTVNVLPDAEVVGILPELLVAQPVPASASLSVDAGTARFVALTEQDLALAPASLGPLSAVALGPDDLGRLTPDIRQAVLTWTTAGGRLLIDAPPTDTVPGLPATWKPVSGLRAPAGQGEVVFTSGALTAGRWAGVVDPTARATGFRDQGNAGGQPLSFALAAAAGLGGPRLRWLIAFLFVYIVIVGPVSFAILRRRRRAELLWVVIPLVAVVFAGVSYTVGSSARSGLRVVHGTIVDTTGGGQAFSYIGVSSPGESTTRLQAPPGWVVARYDDPFNGLPPGQSALTATILDRGIEGRMRLAAGQFAIYQARGPVRFPGQLAVSAQSVADGQASGTVSNTTPFALHDVTVLIGAGGIDIGTLAAGAEGNWQISGEPAAGQGFVTEQGIWPPTAGQPFFGPGGPGGLGFSGPGGPLNRKVGPNGPSFDTASPANLSLWGSAPDGMAPGTREHGVAVAVGWTDGYHPPVVVARHSGSIGGPTAVVGTSPVAAGATVGDFALTRRIVRGALTQVGPGMFVNTNGGEPTVVIWTLPPTAANHQLSLSLPGGVGDINVWSAKGWQVVAGGGASAGSIGSSSGSSSGAAVGKSATGGATVGGISGPNLPPGVTLPPGAVPFPGPMGPGAQNGPPTTVALPAQDVVNGMVSVRLGLINRPIDMSALALKVLP